MKHNELTKEQRNTRAIGEGDGHRAGPSNLTGGKHTKAGTVGSEMTGKITFKIKT